MQPVRASGSRPGGYDQQDAIGAEGAGFLQVLVTTSKKIPFGQHRQAGRPAPLVGLGDLGRAEVGAQQAFAGRGLLDLGDHRRFPEFIADTPEDYVARAVALAHDTGHLAQVRAALRDRMRTSSLCDAAAFTADLERSYREMWVKWCAGDRHEGQPPPISRNQRQP
jgi:hypothetical protein